MGRRKWDEWPKRFKGEVDTSSSIFGLGGMAVSLLGVFVSVPAVTTAGAFLLVGTIGLCAYRAFPARMLSPEQVAGQKFEDIRILQNISPALPRIGLIGSTQAGKSTLLAHLNAQPTPANIRTENPYAVVVLLPGGSPAYFALIDAAGQQYSQQFKVVDEAEHLIIMLDHNEGSSSPEVEKARLKEHEKFLNQLAGHLQGGTHSHKVFHFLLNKRDIWQGGEGEPRLRRWFHVRLEPWKKISRIKVTADVHSNFITGDTTTLFGIMRGWMK